METCNWALLPAYMPLCGLTCHVVIHVTVWLSNLAVLIVF